MCGKFTQLASWRDVVDFSQPITEDASEGGEEEGSTPMRGATVIRLDEERERTATRMRWGWSKAGLGDKHQRPDFIHARAETIDRLPTFREAFAMRRGILVVKTFNAGEKLASGRTRQHVVTPRDGQAIAIAVLWKVEAGDNGPSYSFVMVTAPANKLIGTVTDRMPAVLQPGDWAPWLGEEQASAEELKALLLPYEGDWDMGLEVKAAKLKSSPDAGLS
jgi:putative SOS response-associated peptidase YedK